MTITTEQLWKEIDNSNKYKYQLQQEQKMFLDWNIANIGETNYIDAIRWYSGQY